MKIIKKDQTFRHKNSDSCISTEYPLDDKNIDISIVRIKGRYPDRNRVVNRKCKELVYIMKGSGEITIEEKTITLKKGDTILIEPEEKYYWKGNMTLVVSCSPAWYPEQHENII